MSHIKIVLPDNFVGPFYLVLDKAHGVSPQKQGQVYTYMVPQSGVAKIESLAPFEVKTRFTAHYQNGTSFRLEGVDTPPEALAIRAGIYVDRAGEPPFRVYVLGTASDLMQFRERQHQGGMTAPRLPTWDDSMESRADRAAYHSEGEALPEDHLNSEQSVISRLSPGHADLVEKLKTRERENAVILESVFMRWYPSDQELVLLPPAGARRSLENLLKPSEIQDIQQLGLKGELHLGMVSKEGALGNLVRVLVIMQGQVDESFHLNVPLSGSLICVQFDDAWRVVPAEYPKSDIELEFVKRSEKVTSVIRRSYTGTTESTVFRWE